MGKLTIGRWLSGMAWLMLWMAASAAGREPDRVLRGSVDASAHQTYRLVPFDVPDGVTGLEIRFEYGGREARTTIDLGLLAPGEEFATAFRGWSGGNKSRFVVRAVDATPSYFAGPILPGRWQLLLGVPNIRAGQSSTYVAEIYFERPGQRSRESTEVTVETAPGWYRGDLHVHSGHSDGSCASRSGRQRVPCPTYLSLATAAERGLDFIALTEHNTESQLRELTALQPYFDDLLILPGVELTTFQGHANAFGLLDPIDFRVGSDKVPDWNALLRELARRGALVSVNHPKLPSGEVCMGCGWTPQPAADWSLLQAIEVVNGNVAEGAYAGVAFWQDRLNEGHRLTAIGGSDTHDITAKEGLMPPARIGVPTTVVRAQSLSTTAILEGLRAGTVFVDTQGSADRAIELTARNGDQVTVMGGHIAVRQGERAELVLQVRNVPGGRVDVVRDGVVQERRLTVDGSEFSHALTENGDGQRHWLRIDVRDAEGRLLLIGNPIYFNWPRSAAASAP